jgi:hypothetical protein
VTTGAGDVPVWRRTGGPGVRVETIPIRGDTTKRWRYRHVWGRRPGEERRPSSGPRCSDPGLPDKYLRQYKYRNIIYFTYRCAEKASSLRLESRRPGTLSGGGVRIRSPDALDSWSQAESPARPDSFTGRTGTGRTGLPAPGRRRRTHRTAVWSTAGPSTGASRGRAACGGCGRPPVRTVSPLRCLYGYTPA